MLGLASGSDNDFISWLNLATLSTAHAPLPSSCMVSELDLFSVHQYPELITSSIWAFAQSSSLSPGSLLLSALLVSPSLSFLHSAAARNMLLPQLVWHFAQLGWHFAQLRLHFA